VNFKLSILLNAVLTRILLKDSVFP